MSFKLKIILNLLSIKINKKIYKSRYYDFRKQRWAKFQSVLNRSPYYRNFTAKGASLEEFPIVNKAWFMKHFNEVNTAGIDREKAFEVATKAEQSRDFSATINGITIGLSSGTSGNRGIFLASENERALWVASVLDRVIGFSLKKRTVAFFLRANSNLYDSVKSKVLQFEFFDLLVSTATHLDRLNDLNPTILVAQPSMLMELAKAKQAGLLKITPQKIISVAEVLYEEDRMFLSEVFQQKIHQVYQCTEGFLAATCEEGTLHFNEDFLIIEKKYLDDEKIRFHPVITDLMRQTQPVVRYELNDIVHEKLHCACGSSMLAIEKIEGRSDDVLCFKSEAGKEVKIFPDFFRRAIILANNSIKDYALVQDANTKLSLFIDGSDDSYDQAKNAVLALLIQFEVETVSIERLQEKPHERGNKFRRIRNDIK
jgi:putative adenylate-forming enzyme